MCTATDTDLAWSPCAGEQLRDMVAEHAITLLANWDDEASVTRSAADPRASLSTDAESTGDACAQE